MPPIRHPLRVPDLGLAAETTLTLGQWLVSKNAAVTAGESLLEIVAGELLYELSSPADGVLLEKHAGDDARLFIGQLLGTVEERE